MSLDRVSELAEGLAADWWARAPYRKLDLADLDEAYAVQRALHQLLSVRRGAIAGRKIALSSKAMQQMVGIDSPVAGTFFEKDLIDSPATVDLSSFRHMGIEAELAFRLARDVHPGEAREPFSDLIAEVRPAFELVEDKGVDYTAIDAQTLVADNAWCGGVVLGPAIPAWRDWDIANLTGTLSQSGHPDEATNTGAADPWGSLAWVFEHAASHGDVLRAGEFIITGSAVRTRFPALGDKLTYELHGLSSVSLSLT